MAVDGGSSHSVFTISSPEIKVKIDNHLTFLLMEWKVF